MRFLIACTPCLSAAFAHAQDGSRSDGLRNPAMGNDRGYAVSALASSAASN